MRSTTSSGRRILATAALAAAGPVLLPSGPAAAQPVHGSFHDEQLETASDFCGVEGLTVQVDYAVDGRFQVRPQGRDQLVYVMEHVSQTWVHTNLDTGEVITETQPMTLFKDLSVTDNGDGRTVTIILLGTGSASLRNEDGRLIARGDGQVRFRIVYDYVKDSEVSNVLIFGSTGTNDDFCAAMVAEWSD